MTPYFLMLALPAIAALLGLRASTLLLFVIALVYWLMIGFRFQVGMDWVNYLSIYSRDASQPLSSALLSAEPGYKLLMWLARATGGGYILINAVSALVFCYGFFELAKRYDEPFLAIVIATPLLVIAFAMSATRQALAMGIIFHLFATWENRTLVGRTMLVALASLFHFSAFFVLIFVASGMRVQPHVKALAMVVIGCIIVAVSAGSTSMEAYSERYVSGGGKLQAPGAIAQTAAVALPGLMFVLMPERFKRGPSENALYWQLALAAVASVPAILVSSVGAYRFALYFWPVAMHVWSRVAVRTGGATSRLLYRFVMICASGLVLYGWLTYANNSIAWLPYENWLLQPEGVSLRR